jgi:general secretion pathway protein K
MKPASQRGIALVLVLWMLALIMVIAAGFLHATHTDSLVVRNSLSIARAEAAADAGVHRALSELFRPGSVEGAWKRDGEVHEWRYEGIPVTVSMADESGKIDINTATEPLLKGLLMSAGVDEEEATRLLDAILDWRDADSLKRLYGAEDAEYQAAGLNYRPSNTPFQAIEELQLVLGMRPETYRRIAGSITVFSRQPGIRLQTASREVLMAIPGVTAEQVDAFVAERSAARAEKRPPPPFPPGQAFAIAGGQQPATIRSEARLDDGTVFIRDAVALTRASPRRPFAFLVWREGTLPDEVPAAPADASGAAAAGAAR